MEFGKVSQGFRLERELVVPEGFSAGSKFPAEFDPLDRFKTLLESKLFCCHMCSLSKTWRQWKPRFIISAELSNQRSFGFTRNCEGYRPSYSSHKVEFEPQHGYTARDAKFCMAMLGVLFNLKFNKNHDMAIVCSSVHRDCQNGYISNTLAHLMAT
jgi:hypothetical protein